VVEGAFGGFVEFFGIEGFVGGGQIDTWRIGVGLNIWWIPYRATTNPLLHERVAAVRKLVDRATPPNHGAPEGAMRTATIRYRPGLTEGRLYEGGVAGLLNPITANQ